MEWPKLARVLGMLGSSHDGEVLNAARIAERMVREAGLSWDQVVADLGDESRERDKILAVERKLGHLRQADQAAFLKLREHYLDQGALGAPDFRRLNYLHDLVNPSPSDEDIPF